MEQGDQAGQGGGGGGVAISEREARDGRARTQKLRECGLVEREAEPLPTPGPGK